MRRSKKHTRDSHDIHEESWHGWFCLNTCSVSSWSLTLRYYDPHLLISSRLLTLKAPTLKAHRKLLLETLHKGFKEAYFCQPLKCFWSLADWRWTETWWWSCILSHQQTSLPSDTPGHSPRMRLLSRCMVQHSTNCKIIKKYFHKRNM